MKDLFSVLCAVLFFLTLDYAVEVRYDPETFAERVIGALIVPGDIVTESMGYKRRLHPRGLIARAGRGLNPDEPISYAERDAEVARRLDSETLADLVEKFEIKNPESPFVKELERRNRRFFDLASLTKYLSK
jgi:hypothetical protein